MIITQGIIRTKDDDWNELMFSPPRILNLEGQYFVFNSESKTIILEITQLFMTAGTKLGWPSSLGLPRLELTNQLYSL